WVTAAVAQAAPSRPGFGYRQQARLPVPQTRDEPHPTLMRTPAARPHGARRLCQALRPGRSRYLFVPGSVAIQSSADSPPRWERLDSFEEGAGGGGQVAGEALPSVAVEDVQEQGPGVEIDAGVESGVRRGGEVVHEGHATDGSSKFDAISRMSRL